MFSAPMINDITTTYPNPPEFVELKKIEKSRNYDYNNSFYEIQVKAYNLQPLNMNLTPDETFKKVEKVAQQMGWHVVSVDPIARRLEAIDTTLLLRFKDDIVIEVRPAISSTTDPSATSPSSAVHMRSKSRVGKGDLGKNAKRILSFFEALNSEK